MLLVALDEDRFDLGNRELVIAGPRLRAPQRGDAAHDRRAVVVLALVGVDLGEVDLGELGELAHDLLGAQRVIARDREILLGGDRTFDLPLDLRGAGNLARLPSRSLDVGLRLARRPLDLVRGVCRTGLADVVGRLTLDVGMNDRVGEFGSSRMIRSSIRSSSVRIDRASWAVCSSPTFIARRSSAV
jgi:hypothetical protein